MASECKFRGHFFWFLWVLVSPISCENHRKMIKRRPYFENPVIITGHCPLLERMANKDEAGAVACLAQRGTKVAHTAPSSGEFHWNTNNSETDLSKSCDLQDPLILWMMICAPFTSFFGQLDLKPHFQPANTMCFFGINSAHVLIDAMPLF